jgi:CheY-like chemotaxis protein
MGLPQAYGFARQMGGNLTIQSMIGQGTTITIVLPRAHGSIGAQSQLVKESIPKPTGSGMKILFVEDDPLVSAVVGPALRAEGLLVVEAKNGTDAMKALEKDGPFDAIFSDIVMPGTVSGIDLAEHVRKHSAATRIVLATGYSERRLDMPDVEILAKPYDVKDAVALLCRSSD